MENNTWRRFDYLKNEILVLSVEANFFFTDEENELMLKSCDDNIDDKEKKKYSELLTELIAQNKESRRLRYHRIYDAESLSLEEKNKQYYIGEDGLEHYSVIIPDYLSKDYVLDIKNNYISTEFISEFHRVLNIEPGEFFPRRIIVHWKNQDLAEQLLKNGVIIRIKENDEIIEEHFSLFTASAGQMRTSKFSLISDTLMDTINKRLFCGLTVDKINKTKPMLSSKLLAYRALGCSASERLLHSDGSKFSIRECVVVKDFNYALKDITIDNISSEKIERIKVGAGSSMEHIEENANDGMGLALWGVLPHGIDTCIVRAPWVKGLITSFDYLGFCDYYGIEPIIEDYWGTKHNLRDEGIKIILTESMFKMAAYWKSWEDYCNDWDAGDCYICFLQAAATREEDTYSPLSYQMFQPLGFMTEDEMKEILEQPISEIQRMTSDKGTILNILGADSRSERARDRALAAYPELMKITEWRKDLLEGIRAKINSARASKFNLGPSGKLNRRLFVVREPWALCKYWFLGDDSGTGFCDANMICCKQIANQYDKVALSRSPGLFLDAVIAHVVPDDKTVPETSNPYYWYRTNCVYMSCKDGAYLQMNFDEDGDMLNVILSTPYINALERTINEFNTVVNYYPGLTGKKGEITIDTLAKSITIAAEGNIGTISNSLTKLWNSPKLVAEVEKKMNGRKYNQKIIDDYMAAGKSLLLVNQYTINRKVLST